MFSVPANAGEMLAKAIPVRDFVEAFAPRFGLQTRVCGAANITGKFSIDKASDLAQALAEAGRRVVIDGNGVLVVDCSAADQSALDPMGQYVSGPMSQAALGGGNMPSGNPLDPRMGAAPAPGYGPAVMRAPDEVFKALDTHYVTKKRLGILEGLGLKVLGDPDVPGPLLLVGPAKIIDEAEAYVRSVDVCPRQLRLEATVVTRANTRNRSRGFGLRIGNDKAAIGTAGTADSLIDLPLLQAFLSAKRETFELGTNASFKGYVLQGEEMKLTDGRDIPVRSATSVTDRETRQDIIYRTAGHQLSVKPLSLNDVDAVLLVGHSISAQGAVSDLGPSFNERATSSTFRLRYGEPIILSLSGQDTARRVHSRGILSRNDEFEAADGGSFLVLAVELDRCRAAEGESAQPKAAR